MKRSKLVRVGSYVAGVAIAGVTTVSLAGPASADQYITVSGSVQCVNQSYTLTVQAEKIQTGITGYYFLDGTNLSTATTIGTQQPYRSGTGQNATATWTPTTSGTHDLWMRGTQPGGGIIIGPVPVTVQAAGSAGCSTGTGSADSLPIIGGLLSSLGL